MSLCVIRGRFRSEDVFHLPMQHPEMWNYWNSSERSVLQWRMESLNGSAKQRVTALSSRKTARMYSCIIQASTQRVSEVGELNARYSDRLRAFRSLGDVELDSLAVFKRAITARLDLRMVNEHIFCAAIGSDKAEAFIGVEPFHGSLCHLLLSLIP